MADINLIPTEEKTSSSLASLQQKLTIFSVLVLAVVAVFTVVTLIMFTQLKGQEADLNARISKAATAVSANQLSEWLLAAVSKKADSANKVLGSRLIYTNVLTKTAELMPQGVSFTDLKLSGAKVTSSAKAKTSADVANLVSSFVTTDEGKKLFSSLSIDSLASDDKGNYTFSVSMDLAQNTSQGGLAASPAPAAK